MKRVAPLFISAALAALIAGLTAFSIVRGAYRRAAFDVCDMIDLHYYRSAEPGVQKWLRLCRETAAAQPIFAGRAGVIAEINSILEQLGVSHLFLYTPDENRAIWDHEAVDTGIRARIIDGFMVVHDLIEGGPGDRAGIREGDTVIGIDDQEVSSPDDVASVSGVYFISRRGEEMKIPVRAEPLAIHLGPAVDALDADTLHLRLQSFLARYFETDEWMKIARAVTKYRHVIVDLRGNAGGSFPAMLRVLSSFHCTPVRIGTIYQPKNDVSGATAPRERVLKDELDTESQLKQLDGVAKLHLDTFNGYPCHRGDVTILVDHETSSVSEIFAESFFRRPRSRVWGMPTAGQVVMAQWFPMPNLGEGGFSLSIPIAGYRSSSGVEIESEGLAPERLLYYDLESASQGIDSWLDEAANEPFLKSRR